MNKLDKEEEEYHKQRERRSGITVDLSTLPLDDIEMDFTMDDTKPGEINYEDIPDYERPTEEIDLGEFTEDDLLAEFMQNKGIEEESTENTKDSQEEQETRGRGRSQALSGFNLSQSVEFLTSDLSLKKTQGGKGHFDSQNGRSLTSKTFERVPLAQRVKDLKEKNLREKEEQTKRLMKQKEEERKRMKQNMAKKQTNKPTKKPVNKPIKNPPKKKILNLKSVEKVKGVVKKAKAVRKARKEAREKMRAKKQSARAVIADRVPEYMKLTEDGEEIGIEEGLKRSNLPDITREGRESVEIFLEGSFPDIKNFEDESSQMSLDQLGENFNKMVKKLKREEGYVAPLGKSNNQLGIIQEEEPKEEDKEVKKSAVDLIRENALKKKHEEEIHEKEEEEKRRKEEEKMRKEEEERKVQDSLDKIEKVANFLNKAELGTKEDEMQNDQKMRDLGLLDFEDEEIFEMYRNAKIDLKRIKKMVEVRFVGGYSSLRAKKAAQDLPKRIRKLSQDPLENFTSIQKKTILELINLFDSIQEKKISNLIMNPDKKYYSPLTENIGSEPNLLPLKIEQFFEENQIIKNNFKSVITCLAKSESYIVVGTNEGDILELNKKTKKIRKFKLNGIVLTVDINEDESLFVAGTSESVLFLKKMKGGWKKKKDTRMMNKKPILSVRFYNKRGFVVATRVNVRRVKIKDIGVAYDFMSTKVFKMNLFDICNLHVFKIREKRWMVVVSNLDIVHFSFIGDKIRYIGNIPRPAGITKGWLPVVTSMKLKERDYNYCLIFWKNCSILVKIHKANVIMAGEKKFDFDILWGTVLYNKVVMILDYEFNLRIETLESIYIENKRMDGKYIDFYGDCKLIGNILPNPWRVSYCDESQKHVKSLMEKMRKVNDGIVYISSNKLIEVNLMELPFLVEEYFKNKYWRKALNFCSLVIGNKLFASEEAIREVRGKVKSRVAEYVTKNMQNNEEEVLSIAVEALINCGFENMIFEDLVERVEAKVFWKVVIKFLEVGQLSKIPITILAKGALLLDDTLLEPLLLRINPQDLEFHIEHLQNLYKIASERNLIAPLNYISLLVPEKFLVLFLNKLLGFLENVDQKDLENFNQKIVDCKLGELDLGKLQMKDSSLFNFLALLKFLHKVFTSQNIDENYSKKKTKMMTISIDWLVYKENFAKIAKLNIQILLEAFYYIFLEPEFIHSETAKTFLNLVWKSRISKIKEKNFKSWMKLEDGEDFPAYKCLLLLIESQILDLDDEDLKIDFAFLLVKILNLSAFNELCQEVEWIQEYMILMITAKYRKSRYWLLYKPLNQFDFEEEVLKAIKRCEKIDKAYLENFSSKAERNGYLRVGGELSDKMFGPYQSLKIHMKNFYNNQDGYVYEWAIRKSKTLEDFVKDGGDAEEVRKFVEEITLNLKDLVLFDKDKCKELVMSMPLKGEEVMKYLDSYPDLQVEFFENMLIKEKKRPMNKVSDEIKLKYLELKCRLEPDMVTQILETYNFPLNPALKICTKYKNHFGAAFIKFRIGVKEEAIDEYLKIINYSYKNYLQEPLETKNDNISNSEYAFQKILQLCVLAINERRSEGQKYLRKVLKFIVGGYIIMGRRRHNNPLKKERRVRVIELRNYIKENYIKELLVNMVKYSPKDLPSFVENKKILGGLEMNLSKDLLQLLTNDKKMVLDVENIIMKDHFKEKMLVFKETTKGGCQNAVCSYCNELFIENVGDLFSIKCSHSYHLECAEKLGKYPLDFKCVECPIEKNFSGRILAKLWKVRQPTIEDLNEFRKQRRGKMTDITETLKGFDPVEDGFEMINEMDDESNDMLYSSSAIVLGKSFFKQNLKDPFAGLNLY